jgi:hypothetical protein
VDLVESGASDAGVTLPIEKDASPDLDAADGAPPPRDQLCKFDENGSKERVAVMALGEELVWVSNDGSHERAHAFVGAPADAGPLSTHRTVLTQAGGYVVAVTQFDLASTPGPRRGEVALLGTKSGLLWYRPELSTHVFIGPTGIVALDRAIKYLDGHEDALGGVAIGPPSPEGWVPVAVTTDGPSRFAWQNPQTGSVRPLRSVPYAPAGDPVPAGSGIVYPVVQGSKVSLAVETADAIRSIDLSGAATPSAFAVSGTLYVDLSDTSGTHWLVDLGSSTARRLAVSAPPGQRLFTSSLVERDLRVADDGSLLQLFRDDYRGALYRSGDGNGWSELGRTVAGVNSIRFRERGGSYFMETKQVSSFLPSPDTEEAWKPALPNLASDLGESSQIWRPATGVSWTSPAAILYDWSSLSSDGLCAAYWTTLSNGSYSLQGLDLVGGSTAILASAKSASLVSSAAFVWLE